MNQFENSSIAYYAEIADHELLGREGEIALAKRIEDQEIEVWRRILRFMPAIPVVLKSLEDGGIALPGFEALRRACQADAPKTSSSREALDKQARAVAAAIRMHDRDRVHLAEALSAIDAQVLGGRGRAKWRQGVATAERASTATRQRFVNANLRFVVSMCRQFEGRGISKEDLIQEGNIGLIKSVNRFDHRRGFRFASYAAWWIRHSMQRSIANASRTVRVPVHFQDAHRETIHAQREIATKLGRQATNQEIAERCETTVERIIALRSRALGPAISLDEPLGEDGSPRVDFLVDPANDERSPLSIILKRDDTTQVHELLETLPDKQADVLRKRFGLDGNTPMTLRSIGEQYGLSRERVRQIQGMGLASLRSTLKNQR